MNIYGPTETCIDATYHVATAEDLSSAVLPIGRPLSNYRAYVLDERLEPAGIGVSGELYLGGLGLARGYVKAPALTAEKFVADPFSATPGARLYRTGDRARWRSDGPIEFLGRADHQVKIRGFRVEPGEIEAQLRNQPGVREAAVVALSAAGNVRLLAYYTGAQAPAIEELRAGMAAVLPDYMVPAAFVKLDRLPLSPNGKLDRKALPAPGADAFVSRAFEPPDGPAEEKIAALWAELLQLERVGRQDNFFELGGHSLLAVTLIERMQEYGFPADVRTLFTTPTLAGLAAAAGAGAAPTAAPDNCIVAGCEAITPEMLPLVKLTQPQIDRIAASVPGGAANIQDIYPLAPLQEGILFQHLMSPAGDPYLAPFVLEFDHRQRLDSFLLALQRIVERHDVLRTAMVWKGVDEPVQVVLRQAEARVEEVVVDSAEELLARFDPRTYRLDVSQAPLLRAAAAYERAGDRWLLVLLTHHLILDHTSMEIVVAELRGLMADLQALLPASLPYRNFVAQTRSGMTREQHEAFFRQMLGEVEEPTAPFGLVDVQSQGGETQEGRLPLDAALSQRVREQARALGVTPASLFHLAWAAVLGHICGKRDVVFGTVLFGRMQSGPGADRVVGMFINTLPVRIEVDGTGAAESVRRTHGQLADLLAHEHAPLSLAQRCSAIPAPAPLFSSLFNYRYSPEIAAEMAWPGVEVVFAAERTNYPLSMAVDDSGVGFVLTALGQAGVDAGQVCRYLQTSVAGLLDLLEHAPQTPFESLRVLPSAERRLVVEEWNRTEASFPSGTLDGLFAAQVRRTPEAVAVVGLDGGEITYAELAARSTRLARYLVAQGVGPERVVGVRMERSADTIVALLGILKAGGVYLPLDPAYPSERLAFMAADAGAMLVLESIEGLEGDAELPALDDANRLAYIIYTSGTTGQPKGVAVPHMAAVNLAFARCTCHDPLGGGDRVLAAISVGFDVSIGQLLLPLLSGATVVIAGDVKTMGGTEFWGLVGQRGVTHINSVPSFVDSILDAVPAGKLPLKRLMLGGEALSGALVGRIQRALPGAEVVNMYGPTEACIDATYHVATAEDLSSAVLPIGRPLSNYRAYVLDERLEPAGIGVSGELYLGGLGLARGYVKAPALTAEKFVADPFSATPGARLYRTGDRARWRSDGRIEFLGRADHQVKIRGFRVEPGEIEAALLGHPAVGQAVVVPQTGLHGGPVRLIAYLVPCAGHAAPETASLRSYLAARLPDYMVPAAFVAMAAIPLNANGKLDRGALPAPELPEEGYVAPRNSSEEAVAGLFGEVLGVDRCGATDNFFELGGDSLAAMRLVNAVGNLFQANLPIRFLFDHPTVEAMAAAFGSNSRRSNAGCLVPVQTGGGGPKLFCIHPAGGHVFCYLPLARALGPGQPVFGLQARGLEQDDIPAASSIEEMAADYISAIQQVQPEGPYHLLGMSSGGMIAFEMARQLKACGGEVRLVALLDTSTPVSASEAKFTEEMLVRAMAAELGCEDVVRDAPPTVTLAEMIEMARQARRLPPGFGLAQAERLAKVFRNNAQRQVDYQPQSWGGPLLVLRALRRTEDGGRLPDWSPYAQNLEVFDLDCGHADLVSEAWAPAVASCVRPRLSA